MHVPSDTTTRGSGSNGTSAACAANDRSRGRGSETYCLRRLKIRERLICRLPHKAADFFTGARKKCNGKTVTCAPASDCWHVVTLTWKIKRKRRDLLFQFCSQAALQVTRSQAIAPRLLLPCYLDPV